MLSKDAQHSGYRYLWCMEHTLAYILQELAAQRASQIAAKPRAAQTRTIYARTWTGPQA